MTLFQAVPWAAAVTAKVKDQAVIIRGLKAEVDSSKAKVDPLESRVKELEELSARSQEKEALLLQEKSDLLIRNEVLVGEKQKWTEAKEADRLELRRLKKELKKVRKIISRSEDRGFSIGYDDAVIAAHQAGLDYKQILFNPDDDPILRPTAPDVPLVVSSDPDSE